MMLVRSVQTHLFPMAFVAASLNMYPVDACNLVTLNCRVSPV